MLIMAIGMFLGYKMNGSLRAVSGGVAASVGDGNLGEIMNLVRSKYVDTVATDSIENVAIDQLLSQLDPHSVYIPPKDMQAVDEDLGGSFEGIGIEFYLLRDTLNITSVISGGPGEEAGLESGDKIIKVNDSIIAGVKISDEQIIKKLRGRGGSKVRLAILRSGKKITEYTVTRGTIPLSSIDASYMLQPTIGYIKINRFAENTYEEFSERLKKLQDKGATKLVIDLRDNPGGYLEASTAIADLFVAGKKLLVYTKGRKNQQENYKCQFDGPFEKGDVAVLIDEGSASAAEILSGSLQDNDRATIIGRRSFGKGLVQEQYPLSQGGALRLTVARYYLPSGRCIQKDYSGGKDSYKDDVQDRFKHGELISADSVKFADTTIYKTLGGKRVYGGGGIMPDVFVPLDTNKFSRRLSEVLASGYLSEITNDYISTNKAKLTAYKSATELINNFTEYKALLETLKQKCAQNNVTTAPFSKPNDVVLMASRIKAQIAKSILGADAQYEVANANDEFLKKALEVLGTK
jgi:carboxyl-terminal processing protease